MRLSAVVVACILVIPHDSFAQGTTADGVRALFQGDRAAAERILKPLAEDRPDYDPLAAFFLALAYQFRGGEFSDSTRVCGLFLKAATPANPLMPQAVTLAAAIHQNHPWMLNNCALAVGRGWGTPQWTTLVLGPEHRVRIHEGGFTVTFNGAETQTREGWGGAGWRFLPIRLTSVAPAGGGLRHFVEIFTWIPHSPDDAPLWSLAWFAYEVRGTDVVRLEGSPSVSRHVGQQPPASFQVDDAAQFAYDSNGVLQRIVVGDLARAVPVETERLR